MSMGKILSFMILYEHIGESLFEQVGCSFSNELYNSNSLNDELKPHNPFQNNGSLMVAYLLAQQRVGLDEVLCFV